MSQKWYIVITVGKARRCKEDRDILYDSCDPTDPTSAYTEFSNNILRAKLYDSTEDAYDSVDCAFWQAEQGDMLDWCDELDDYDYCYDVLPYPPELLAIRELMDAKGWMGEKFNIERSDGSMFSDTIDEIGYLLRMGGLDTGEKEIAAALANIVKGKIASAHNQF